MADAKAQFAVELKDETTGAAQAAAGALDKLERQIARDQKALKDLERTMRASKKASFDSNTDYIALAASIQKKRDSIAGASRDFLALGGSFGMASRRAKEGASAAAAIAKGLMALHSSSAEAANDNGKVGKTAAVAAAGLAKVGASAEGNMPKVAGFSGKLQKLIGDLGEGGLPFAALSAAAALTALAAASAALVIGGLTKLIGFAVSSQEELAGVSQAAINVAKRSPIARSEIAKLGTELEKTGLKGAALEAALEKAVEKKYGDAAKKSMLSLSVQVAKAKENLSLLFAGVKTGPLLSAAKELFGLLDTSTATGRALKAMIETLLDPILGAAPSVGAALKQAFQGATIGALKLGIAALTVRNRVRDMVSGVNLGGWKVDWMMVGQAAIFVGVAFAAVVAAIGVVVGLVAASVGVVAALAFGFGVLAVKAWQTGAALIGGIAKAVSTVWNYASNFVSMGLDFAAGLASGILSGLSSVISAAKQIAKSAVDTVKSTLGIKSPSKVLFEAGANTSAGMAGGIEAGSPDVQRAADGMLAIPRDTAAGGAAPATSGGVTVRIDVLQVNGVKGSDDPNFPNQIAEVLEQAATMLGVRLAVT